MVTNEVAENFQNRDLLWKAITCLGDDVASAFPSSML